jgi:hypothetical protein
MTRSPSLGKTILGLRATMSARHIHAASATVSVLPRCLRTRADPSGTRITDVPVQAARGRKWRTTRNGHAPRRHGRNGHALLATSGQILISALRSGSPGAEACHNGVSRSAGGADPSCEFDTRWRCGYASGVSLQRSSLGSERDVRYTDAVEAHRAFNRAIGARHIWAAVTGRAASSTNAEPRSLSQRRGAGERGARARRPPRLVAGRGGRCGPRVHDRPAA